MWLARTEALEARAMTEVLDLTAARRQRRRGPRTEQLVTKKEIAARLEVSERTIERWMAEREFPFYKPFEGGSVRFEVRECDAWLVRRRR
jgi:excisionase family DNA binding protein